MLARILRWLGYAPPAPASPDDVFEAFCHQHGLLGSFAVLTRPAGVNRLYVRVVVPDDATPDIETAVEDELPAIVSAMAGNRSVASCLETLRASDMGTY